MQSFGLYRTNPKLSGNLKITVSSDDKIYLNTIDASEELSDKKYKKYVVNPNHKLSYNIFNFLNKNKIPNDIIFKLGKKFSDVTIKTDFTEQYETIYDMGVERCDSLMYNESFSFFAPLWLSKNIPKYFIIFAVDDPKCFKYEKNPKLIKNINYTVISKLEDFYITYKNKKYKNKESFIALNNDDEYFLSSSNGGYLILNDQEYEYSLTTGEENLTNIVNKSNIVKIFDLSENTNIGKYIKNHHNDSLFKEDCIDVNIENKSIKYFGMDITTGVVNEAIEYNSNLFSDELPISEFDDNITLGFERNKILSSNLLNLEFLFDDNISEDFKFIRYFGFYCDDLDLTQFDLDLDKMFGISGLYKDNYLSYDVLPKYYQNNIADPYGIKIIPNKETFSKISTEKFKIGSSFSFFYIKDINGNINKLERKENDHLILNNKSIDTFNLCGVNKQYTDIKAFKNDIKGRDSNIIRVHKELYNDFKIKLFYNNILVISIIGDNLYDVTTDELQKIINDFSDKNIKSSYQEGTSIGNYFYPFGTIEEIALGISKAFKYSLKGYNIDAVAEDNKIVLVSKDNGNQLKNWRITVDDNSYVTVDDNSFNGGTLTPISKIIVDKDFSNLFSNNSYLAVNDGYCRIKSISPYIDEPVYNNKREIIRFKNIDKFITVSIVDDNKNISIDDGVCKIHNQQKLSFGLFSLCGLKYFDCSIFKSDYNKNKNIGEYEKYFNIKILEIGHKYTMFNHNKDGYIVHNNEKFDYFKIDSFIVDIGTLYINKSLLPSIPKQFGLISLVDDTGNLFDYEYQSVSDGGDSYIFDIFDISVSINYAFIYNCFKASTQEFETSTQEIILIDNLYYNDIELKNFIGFGGLDVGEIKTISLDNNILENKIKLFSKSDSFIEYKRLRETDSSKLFLKTQSLPYICKWVKNYGLNIINTPYKLNFSPAYEKTNFSPSHLDIVNPKYYTHNWLYLGGHPSNYTIDSEINENYIGEKFLEENITSIEYDYFSDYFISNFSIFNGQVKQHNQINRYSEIKKNINNQYETFFRGIKLLLTSEYDITNYKFSAVLNISNSEYLKPSKPISFKIIQNDVFKNITFLVDVVIDDYKITKDIVSYEYLFLYVMKSLNKKSDTNNNNYGVKFDFPNIDPKTLQNINNEIITNFYGYQLYSKFSGIGIKNNELNFDDSFNVFDFYLPSDKGIFNRLIGIDEYNALMITCENPTTNDINILKIDNKNTIIKTDKNFILSDNGLSIFNIKYLSGVGAYDPVSINNSIYDLSKLIWFIENGGYDVYLKIQEYLSFSNIMNIINNKQVEYKHIKNNISNEIIDINILKPSSITISNILSPYEENFIISNKLIKDISFIKNNTSSSMYRYGGKYSPNFKNVINFKDILINQTWYINDKTWLNSRSTFNNVDFDNYSKDDIQKSTLLCNKNVLIDPSSFIIDDDYYHIVGEKPIINNPIYPISSKAIEIKNKNVLLTDFDAKYLMLYQNNNIPVSGTNMLKDTKSFISKYFKISEEITINNLSDTTPDVNISDVNYEMINKLSVYEMTKTDIIFRFSKTNILKEYFRYNIIDDIENFVSECNIQLRNIDEATAYYFEKNIIQYYNFDDVKILFKKTSNPIDLIVDYTEIKSLELGYSYTKNFSILNVNNDLVIKIGKDENINQSFNIILKLIS